MVEVDIVSTTVMLSDMPGVETQLGIGVDSSSGMYPSADCISGRPSNFHQVVMALYLRPDDVHCGIYCCALI